MLQSRVFVSLYKPIQSVELPGVLTSAVGVPVASPLPLAAPPPAAASAQDSLLSLVPELMAHFDAGWLSQTRPEEKPGTQVGSQALSCAAFGAFALPDLSLLACTAWLPGAGAVAAVWLG